MTQNSVRMPALTQAGLNLIQQAISIYDNELRLAVSNAKFREMFDLPVHLVTPGAHFSETIRHLAARGEYGEIGDLEVFVREREAQARTFEPHYMERTRANGQTISVEGSPLAQGGWVTVYTDITAIKRQEALLRARSEVLSEQVLTHTEELAGANRALAATNAALEQTKRELTEMESRARLTAEMLPAHIARLNRARRYTYSNKQLGRILPGAPRDIIGLSVREALGDEACERITPYLARAYEGEGSVFEFGHGDSGRRLRVAFTPDRDEPEGEVRGVYVLSMDVTEEAQARAALQQTRKRALAAQLTSGMAHDFSNLLTIIMGLQSRLGRMDLDEDARPLVEATLAAARRGGALLDRIASISGPREMRLEPVNVADLIAGTETLAQAALGAEVVLRCKVSELPAPLLLDAGAVQDILLNLVLNARDAIGEGPGEILLRARPIRETWLELTVSDTGPGFAPEALDQALDPFFTTKGGEGSGLGLSMVFDHAQLAGGQVKLANGKRGAVVTVRLPLRRAETRTAPLLVLLVEDSPDIRREVREMLTGLGHQVIEAASAEEAEGLAEIDGIGAILSDIMLGGGDTGDELLSRLRARGVDAPAGLMTSLPPGDRRRAGAEFPVLAKPFHEAELAAFLATELLP